jgi:hypothetical protein
MLLTKCFALMLMPCEHCKAIELEKFPQRTNFMYLITCPGILISGTSNRHQGNDKMRIPKIRLKYKAPRAFVEAN